MNFDIINVNCECKFEISVIFFPWVELKKRTRINRFINVSEWMDLYFYF